MKKILFVCLGNICRSPMAEGVFNHLIEKQELNKAFHVDSAGTGAYHIGNLPDKRMRETAFSHGINLTSKARQVNINDFNEFDYIIAMDRQNENHLLQMAPKNHKAKVLLMRNFDSQPEDFDVPDPYYGGIAGFENVYQILLRSCDKFLRSILT